jgi:hypothetical protein
VLSVSAAAGVTALTVLQNVKDSLSIADTSEDSYITSQIAAATSAIVSYLNVAVANDGTRTLGRETLIESYYPVPGGRVSLVLSRWPVFSITSVTADGETIDPAEYECEGAGGLLFRLSTDGTRRLPWRNAKIVVTYVAGWKLPGESGRTLPQEIESAAIEYVKWQRAGRTRDPNLRSESILEGLYGYTLFSPSDYPNGLPPTIEAMLTPFRNITW